MSKQWLTICLIAALSALAILAARAQDPSIRGLYTDPRANLGLNLGMYFRMPALPPAFNSPEKMPPAFAPLAPAPFGSQVTVSADEHRVVSGSILQSATPAYSDYREFMMRRSLPLFERPTPNPKAVVVPESSILQPILPAPISPTTPPSAATPSRPRDLYSSPR